VVNDGACETVVVPQARRPMTTRLRSLREPGWTVAIAAILVYLFVIHSFMAEVGAAAIVIGLAALLLEGRPLRVPSFLVWLGAFLVWAAATIPLGWAPGASLDKLTDFGKTWLIAFLIANASRSEKQWRIVMIGWLAMFALFPFRGTAINFALGLSHAGRYAWNFTFANPNDLAAISLLVFALCIAFVRTPRPAWVRWSARLGAASMPLLILITGSRGALVALATFALVMLAFSRKRLATSAVLFVIAIASFPFLPANLRARFADMKFLTSTETVALADGSAEQRLAILQVGATVAKDHLLTGVGVGNYPIANFQYAATRAEWRLAQGYKDSHNSYLTLVAETGLPGLLLMGAAVLSTFVSLIRSLRKGRRLAPACNDPILKEALINRPPVLIAGLASFVVAGVFGSLMYFTYPYLFAVVAQGVTHSALERARGLASPGGAGRGPAETAKSGLSSRAGRRRLWVPRWRIA
jgi:O-antigen ligase